MVIAFGQQLRIERQNQRHRFAANLDYKSDPWTALNSRTRARFWQPNGRCQIVMFESVFKSVRLCPLESRVVPTSEPCHLTCFPLLLPMGLPTRIDPERYPSWCASHTPSPQETRQVLLIIKYHFRELIYNGSRAIIQVIFPQSEIIYRAPLTRLPPLLRSVHASQDVPRTWSSPR